MNESNGMDEQWVRIAVERYQRPLVIYAHRLLGSAEAARDVVQETFLRLCREDAANLNGRLAEWLYTVCRNRAMDVRRKERRMTELTDTAAETFAGRELPAAEIVEQADSKNQMLNLLDRLPENQREVIRLKFQHGMSYKQIAEITGLSTGNVGFLIHTGLKTMREKMRDAL